MMSRRVRHRKLPNAMFTVAAGHIGLVILYIGCSIFGGDAAMGTAMDNGIHFISGLPRSGSTLLGAILSQNPRFHAGMSSPVAQMFSSLQTMLSGRNEFHVFIDD